MLNLIQLTSNFLKERTDFSPEIGIILGTGLGGLVDEINISHPFHMKKFPTFLFQQLKVI